MIIDICSDLHGFYPKLEGGDLLIVAGDLTSTDKVNEYFEFSKWLSFQDYNRFIIISGNHDGFIESKVQVFKNMLPIKAHYLCDSNTEFEGLKIYGSPWSKTFPGMNPHCKAFTVDTEEELAEKWELIPEDTDILITHSPPHGFLDKNLFGEHYGSDSLRNLVLYRDKLSNLKLHCFGHIHECGGKQMELRSRQFVNASVVNERYQHVNKPVRFVL